MATDDILNLKLNTQGDLVLKEITAPFPVFTPDALTAIENSLVMRLRLDETRGNRGNELLSNPSFEDYPTTPGAPPGWLISGGTTLEREATQIAAGEGTYAVKVTAQGAGTTEGIVQDIAGLQTGKSYLVGAWIKRAVGNTSPGIRLQVRNVTDGVTFGPQTTLQTNTDYEFVVLTFYCDNAADTWRLRVIFDGTPAATDVLYVDGATCKEIVAEDSSGRGHHAVLRSGATVNVSAPRPGQVGKVGTGYIFEGTNDSMVVQHHEDFNSPTFTLEAWAERDGVATSRTIMRKGDPDAEMRWALRGNQQQWQFRMGVDGTILTIQSGNIISINTWYHVVAVFDGSMMYLYVDGALVASQAVTGSTLTMTEDDVWIGTTGTEFTNFYAGTLDELGYYNRALTAAEVLARYNATVGGVRPAQETNGVYTQTGTEDRVVALDLETITGQEAIRQDIQVRCLTSRGERVLHPDYGIDFPKIEVPYDENLVRGEVVRTILEDPDVEEITDMEILFTGRTRRASFKGTVKILDDDLLPIEGDT